ncbi:PEP-CTERM sorting domain-containing protein [Arsukibacterium sp.]|uniref:PEP-CTERM sorting domain-containing protein n=1 Tax=Arsukibacterium sp. TaxID=1977258 RepID=UPI002FD9EA23
MFSTPIRMLLGAASLLAASFSSQATLIVNGDFESNTVNPGNWKVFISEQVAGWEGSNIEIWNALQGVTAASGNQFIELNAHGIKDSVNPNNAGPWSIFQLFATDVGQQYEFSFFYRARNNGSEQFKVDLADISWVFNDHTTAGWTTFSSVFTANSRNTLLRFTSLNDGSTGNFLDGISVVALQNGQTTQAVPEPATLAAFGLGLLALVGSRRLRGKQA